VKKFNENLFFSQNGKILEYNPKTNNFSDANDDQRRLLKTIINPREYAAFSIEEWIGKDKNFKIQLVTAMVSLFRADGVTIRLPVEFYVEKIDQLIQNSINNSDNRQCYKFENSWDECFKIIAAMEGDWGNGKDKVQVAQEIMGYECFNQFSQIYPEKYINLLKHRTK
jgi:hypothetical protein